ncbi:MAG: SulP family inorganic anion transporter [Deltaproteobacteria bacterium]|nr:SulP family inorganic anion transporter [Deltaproteobacteria bacterium]
MLVPPWLKGYRREDLPGDLSAGLTTAVLLIPQGMAYAMLAGLPPVVGLYASTAPLFLYALVGSSRQLAVGPAAMIALMVGTAVGGLSPEPAGRVPAAVLLAALVGIVMLGMAALRLDRLTRVLTHPVLVGFTGAAALIIGASQLRHLLGVELPRTHALHQVLGAVIARLDQVHGLTAVLGAGSVALLLVLERTFRRLPRALLVMALATLGVLLLGPAAEGIAVVGEVPAGLPAVALPTLTGLPLGSLGGAALAIALVAYVESISVARAFARRSGHEIDPRRELLGLSLANLGGSLVGAFPVTGGFGRTAVNAQAGAKSPVASLVSGVVLLATLLFLTPLFEHLPRAVLAAIIVVAVSKLFDHAELRRLYREARGEFAEAALTFAGTLALGIEAGLAVGVIFALGRRAWLAQRRAPLGEAVALRRR